MTPPPRILCVSSQSPWPLDRGGHIRSFYLMRALAQQWRVSLVAGLDEAADEAGASLKRAGIDVRLAPLPKRTWPSELARAGVALLHAEPYVLFHRHNRPQMWDTLRGDLRDNGPIAAAYLDHLDSWLFASAFVDTPLLVDLHNVYSTLVHRESMEARKGPARIWLRRDARGLARIEQQIMQRASLVCAVSEMEREYYAGLGPAPIALVENGVDAALYDGLPVGRSIDPPAILYLGTMSWSPNQEAVTFLASKVLPAIRRAFPGARLRVVGRNPSEAVRKLTVQPGVEVVGQVTDVRPFLEEASVLAVPLEVGGGTRLKILEAFAAGLPVISSPIGCEGLAVRDGEHLVMCDRNGFADGLRSLLGDAALGRALATGARALVAERYDWTIIGERLRTAVGHVLAQES